FQIVVDLEDRVELRHFEQLADLGPGVEELGLAPLVLRDLQGADERAEPRAVEESHALQIDEQVDGTLFEKARDRLLDGGLRLSDHERPSNGQDGPPPLIPRGEFHESGDIMSKTGDGSKGSSRTRVRRTLPFAHMIASP